jgi:hypothetical protein
MSTTRRIQLTAVCIALSAMSATAALHEYREAAITHQSLSWRILCAISIFGALFAITVAIGSRQFSVRTLLIVTTLVAIALGLIAAVV